MQETVLFADSSEDWLNKYNSMPDATFGVGMMDDLTLSDFFKRPVLISSHTWQPGVVLDSTFNPWTLFMNNPRVANRISNYNLMNGSLHVKAIIDGSPFYYGKAILSYLPLHDYDTITVPSSNSITRITTTQRLHGYLNPTTCTGCELVLPYIWLTDHVNIPAGEFSLLGECTLYGFNDLHYANGVFTTPLNIQIYAWSDDMKVSCVTSQDISGLVAQSGEYSKNPVSNVATTVAKIAHQLENVPMIGSYAKATNMISTGISTIAKSLGYSSPTMIENPVQNHPLIVGGICNVDRGDPCMKLSVDSKQELSIDPRTVGLDGTDQMVIRNIAMRESFLTSVIWLPTNATETLKWNARVKPVYSNLSSSKYYLTPCTFAALPFNYWRGTMRYRFEVVCTPYHRGRLKVVFDPNFISGSETNVTYSRIIDIGKETEFTIDIGWANAAKFLGTTGLSSTDPCHSTTAYTNRDTTSNGVVALYVLNQLTSSSLDTSLGVDINVYVSMTDDCEFAFPVDRFTSLTSVLVPQSGEIDLGITGDTTKPKDNVVNDMICMTQSTTDHTMDVYFGEVITSFRQLLHRYNYYMTVLIPSVAVPTMCAFTTCNFPLYRGLSSRPAHTDRNYVQTTLLNYLAPAYLMHRGAIRSKYMVENYSTDDVMYMSVKNIFNVHQTLSQSTQTMTLTSNANVWTAMTLWDTFGEGAHITEFEHQPNLEVEHPYYRATRFSCNKDPVFTANDSSAGWGSHKCTLTKKGLSSTTLVHRFVAIGEDFSLFLFQGCPPLYLT